MMFVKTLCNKPGCYVEVAPAGVRAILSYNRYGMLEDITVNSKSIKDCDYFEKLRNLVPLSISLTDGTTNVDGVFSCDSNFMPSGKLSSSVPYEVEAFYAGNVVSKAASFRGPIVTRNWLSANKFNVLPGTIVPVEFNEDSLANICNHSSTIDFPFISGFYLFEDLECRFVESLLNVANVKSINTRLTSEGYIQCVIDTDNDQIISGYSAVRKYNITDECRLIYFKNSECIEITGSDRNSHVVSSKFVCPICSKQFEIPLEGPCQCDDPNCLSRIYPDAVHMLSTLGLPIMKYSSYIEMVRSKEIQCISDVLDKMKPDEYVSCSLADALIASIPVSVCSDSSIIVKFANTCNNIDTLMYYIKNPSRIRIDMNCNSIHINNMISWLEVPENVLTVQSILSSVNISERTSKFDGAPIFRGRKIAITGKFRRGSISDISSILKSYAAEDVIMSRSDDKYDCLITGSLKEDEDGSMIADARNRGIYIFDEDEFFSQFDIDSDLSTNLL